MTDSQKLYLHSFSQLYKWQQLFYDYYRKKFRLPETGSRIYGQKEEQAVKITKNAIAGTLESSDAMVTVEPNEEGAGIEFELDSVVINQFGNSIRKTVMETLDRLDVKDVKISIVDKGALDCTLKARVEGAVFRGAEQTENLPWGGAIR